MPGELNRLHTLNTARTEEGPRPRLKPRGLPPALEPYGVYAAGNPAEASMYGRDLLGVHRVHVDGPDVADFQATFHAVLVRDVTLGYLDYTTAVRVEIQELPENYLVIVPASGTSVISNEGETVNTTPVRAATPAPSTAMTLQCEADAAHLVVRINRNALEVHLSRLLGRTVERPIRFDLALDLVTGSASRWNFAVQMLHAELYDPTTLLRQGIGLGQLEEFVMSSLLYTQPSNYSAMLTTAKPSERHSVRLAREFIEANLALPIDAHDIARAAGVSVRTLQLQFSQDLSQTPTGYLRNRRLERARADLADASPGSGITVTDIAVRWGFSHLGRFALSYRARFGESPSETLRS